MSKPQVINTLESKRKQLEDRAAWLERELEQTQASLSHVAAVMHLYEAPDDSSEFPTQMNLNRLFKRHELPRLCREALANAPDGIDTRQIAIHAIKEKGLNDTDRHLRTSIAFRAIQVLRRFEKRGEIVRNGKSDGAVVWRLA